MEPELLLEKLKRRDEQQARDLLKFNELMQQKYQKPGATSPINHPQIKQRSDLNKSMPNYLDPKMVTY